MDVNDDLGTLERDGELCVLRYRRTLRQPPERVWRALTEDAHLAGWFPTTIEGERVPGAPLRFSFRQGEAPPFDGEMMAFEPPSLMELRWAGDILRFEVEPAGAGSELRLIVTFDEHGKATRDGAGWHVCLERLELGCGAGRPDPPPDRWRVVHERYVEALGPEASAIGPPS